MKDVIHALTIFHEGISNNIVSSVEIVNPFTEKKVITKGLWDTGATDSAITLSLAKELGLIEVQRIAVSGVHGVKEVPVYYVEIELNDGDGAISLRALVSECTELSSDGSVGALIGMNVINRGDFAISNFGGKTTMSFRTPSLQKIDFRKDV